MSDPVKVVIDTPGPTITVADKALELYQEALKHWTPTRGIAAGTGFQFERSGG